MKPERLARMKQVLDRRQPDLSLFLERVHKPHNLSAILRTCDAVGVHHVHVVPEPQRFSYRRRYSSGTAQWVRVVPHDDVARGIETLHAQGARVLAAHLSGRAIDFRDVDYTQPVAILLGAELGGVSDEAASLADDEIVIPMMGLGASLNVSVAAAVILYEAQRQRLGAGLYERPRLDAATYRSSLFEWLYPRVAEMCRRRGVEYPCLDEAGNICAASPDDDSPA